MNLNAYYSNRVLQPRSFIHALTSNCLVVESATAEARVFLLHGPAPGQSRMDDAVVLMASNAGLTVSRNELPLMRVEQRPYSLATPQVTVPGGRVMANEFVASNADGDTRRRFVVRDGDSLRVVGASNTLDTDSSHAFVGLGWSNVPTGHMFVYQVSDSNAVHGFFHGTGFSSSREMARLMTSNARTYMGINTTKPDRELTVVGDASVSGSLTASNLNASVGVVGFLTASNLIVQNGALIQATGTTPALVVVGQGLNNTPIAQFNVYGSNGQSSNVLTVTSSGVGIGTTTPRASLDVAGGAFFASNVTIGTSNGPPLTVSSRSMVSNLNSEFLGGVSRTFYQTANNLIYGTLPDSVFPMPSNLTAGTYGNASNVPCLVIDQSGRTTTACNVAIYLPADRLVGPGLVPCNLLPPTGVVAAMYGSTITIPRIYIDGMGRITYGSNVTMRIDRSMINGTFLIDSIEGLSAALIAGCNASNITTGMLPVNVLPTVSGLAYMAYGSSSNLVRLVIDVKGRVVEASNLDLLVPASGIVGPSTLNSNVLPATGVTAGLYGNRTVIPMFRVDASGRMIFASNVPFSIMSSDFSSAIPQSLVVGLVDALTSGSNATNIRTGTLPDNVLPTIPGLVNMAYGSSSNLVRLTIDVKGRVITASNLDLVIPAASVIGPTTLSETVLPVVSTLTAGVYGTATTVPRLTLDTRGRVLSVTSVPIDAFTVLPVTKGGTGVSTNTQDRLLVGNGTNPIYSSTIAYDSLNTYVGVGVTNPQYKLDVLGGINFTGPLSYFGKPIQLGYVLNEYQWSNACNTPNMPGLGSPGDVVIEGDLYVKGKISYFYDTRFFKYYPVPYATFASSGLVGCNLPTGLNSPTGSLSPIEVMWGGTGSSWLNMDNILVGNGCNAIYTTNQLFWDRTNARLGVRTSSPAQALHVAGKILANDSISAYSDIRYKTNVHTLKNSLAAVRALRGVRYQRVDTGETHIGLIAQELEQVVPEVVQNNPGGKSVDYGNLVALLIEAVKELAETAESQAATIERLVREGATGA